MKKTLFILFFLLVVVVIGMYYIVSNISDNLVLQEKEDIGVTLDPAIADHIQSKSNLIILDTPKPNEFISSPLTIAGKARGYWFFEASFPIVLTNWDGLIIAEYYATATGDWMTEEFVPFTAVLEFERPDTSVSNRGSLILQRDNPSDLPQNDDALEIPILFK